MEPEKQKRKASPNAPDADFTPDCKIQAIDEEEYVEAKRDEAEEVMEESPYMYRLPHLTQNITKLECFYKEIYSEILTRKVIVLPQLKPKVDDLVSSFRRFREDDFDLKKFDVKVNDLHGCSDFIDACARTCIEVYSSKKPAEVRRKFLLKDGFLTRVLDETNDFAFTRGFLSALLAYWGNEAFRIKVRIRAKQVWKTELEPRLLDEYKKGIGASIA